MLESILKLITKCMQPKLPLPPRRTGFERRLNVWATPAASSAATTVPPVKKRKLNCVPAGASDWDVPFPFAEGEGPEDYQRNWERDRGKQLVVELIQLIKIAARKAAAKKYLAQQKTKEPEKERSEQDAIANKVNGHCPLDSAPHGREVDKAKGQLVSMNTSNAWVAENNRSSTSNIEGNDSTSTSLSSDIGSFVVSPPPDGLMQIMPSLDELFSSMKDQNVSHGPLTTSGVTPTSAVLKDGNQKVFDTWMNFLEAFPIQFDGTVSGNYGLSSRTTPATSPPLSLRSTPSIDDPAVFHAANNQDIDAMLKSLLNQPFLIPNTAPSGVDFNTQGVSLLSQSFESSSTVPGLTSTVSDYPIGCTLLATSNLHSNVTNADNSRAASPFVSASALGGSQDATTPASSSWDFSLPDNLSGGSSIDGNVQGMFCDFLYN